MKNVVDVASFFFPSIYSNLVTTFFFFSHFRQCHCHNWFPFWAPPSMHFGHFTGRLGNTGRTRILVILLPKFNFLSPLTHCTFSCNFGNTVAEIQSLFSFCQITLNSTYNNNKLRFLQFLAKRLEKKKLIIVMKSIMNLKKI